MSNDFKWQLVCLLVVAVVLLAAGIGLRDPWPADEPRFALIARDMAEGGGWLFPRIGGVLYSDKPPLYFWLVAALTATFGSVRVAFLLPGLIAGMGTLALVADLARRLWEPRVAICSAAVLLAILQFPLQMKSGQIDGLLCLWTTLSLYGFCRHLLLGPEWRWYAVGGLAAGLGVITKGVGFLPYFLFIPYAIALSRAWPVTRIPLRDGRWLLAPLATAAAVVAWLAPMLLATGADPGLGAYRDDILFHQTVTRYANAWGHIKPPWYLLTNAVPWLWLPVSAALPWLVPAWLRDLKKKDAAVLLLGSWVLLVLLFFSISAGKRSVYILPAAPALALITGLHASELLRRTAVRRILAGIATLLAAALVAVAMYALMNPHGMDHWIADVPTLVRSAVAMIVTGLVMFAASVLSWRRVRIGFPLAMIAFWFGMSVLVAPALNDMRSGKAIMQSLAKLSPGDAEIAFVGWPEQFLLQWRAPVVHFGYRRGGSREEVGDAIAWLTAAPGRSLLLPSYAVEPCFDRARVTGLGRAHRREWVVVELAALTTACADDVGRPERNVVRYAPPGRQRPGGSVHAAIRNFGPVAD